MQIFVVFLCYNKSAGDAIKIANSSMTNSIKMLMSLARRNPSGLTIATTDFEKVTRGWVIALKETQNSFGIAGCEKAFEVAKLKTGYFGGWKMKHLYYFDAVIITFDEDEAVRLGIENEQIGIYNIETGRYVELS